MRIAVTSAKGGVGKTTTAVMLAALLGQERPTVLIDGDRQGSALTWRHQAGEQWPGTLPVERWTDPLHEQLTRVPSGVHEGLSHVVIDTGPGDPERMRAAVAAADVVVIPVGARMLDVAQLQDTARIVAGAAHPGLSWGVLLTMRRGATRSGEIAPAVIERDGFPLWATEVPLRESIAAAAGTYPSPVPAVYRDLLEELREVNAEGITDAAR
ncbi:nucleotide-binding protein [Actinomycetospora soli]|uniref:nucleotide-binding protein n=1 Tax=Actinomycetospora soli TaxID=2893887 RepID=UPI001E2F489A|nr:AAA family ATPase [Actinomycetospora soli]MCD2191658.1 AAA family ATPase [Actinomycetospora soli]